MDRAVSILVVTYDNADEISACVAGALTQAADQPVEVVVVDNASSDGTRERIPRHPAVRVIASERNDGFAGGVNRAFAASTHPWVLLLNPDCRMDGGCVTALLAHLADRPDLAAAAAFLRNPDGTPQLFARREVDLAQVFWNFTEIGRRFDERRFGGRHQQERRYTDEWSTGVREPLAVDTAAAACVLFRRADLEPVPLDEALPLFFNDTALFRRLRAQGRGIEVVPAANAEHGYGTTHRRLDRARRHAEFVASLCRYARPWPVHRRLALRLLLALDAVAALGLDAAGRGRPTTRDLARGALGGLGLPGGARPWLSAPAGPWRTRPSA